MNTLQQLQQTWDDLAELDPLWAMSTKPDKQFNRWEEEEFFFWGRDHIRRMFEKALNLGLVINLDYALDFGCGVGRQTQALAEKFHGCEGVDVSPKMIALANRYNKFGDRCRYRVNSQPDLSIYEDNQFDVVYSFMALQHNTSDDILLYLREFIRVLKPGGIAMFQVPLGRRTISEVPAPLAPTSTKGLPRLHPVRIWNKARRTLLGTNRSAYYSRLRYLGVPKRWLYFRWGLLPRIDMNSVSQQAIQAVFDEAGAKIVHCEMNNAAGSYLLSADFFVVKS